MHLDGSRRHHLVRVRVRARARARVRVRVRVRVRAGAIGLSDYFRAIG